MSVFGVVQLVLDVVFLFLILLLLVGRSWRRGARPEAEQEAYREMVTALSALIREMKEAAAEAESRLDAKRTEVERALAAADGRLRELEAAAARESVPAPVSVPAPAARAAKPAAAAPSTTVADGGPAALDDDERRERYRAALDLARKGWSALEIARHMQLPRGEVELLIKTKGGGA